MKKLLCICLSLAFLLNFMACNKEQETDEGKQIGNLQLSKAKPMPGESLQINYEGKDSSATTAPKAYFQYMVHQKVYPQDINLKDSAGAWKGQVTIPDSATAIAFNFKNDKVYDSNNKLGFVQPLFQKNGDTLAGSRASVASYYANYGENYNIEISEDSAFTLVRKDIEKNPELKKEWGVRYAMLMKKHNKNTGEQYIEQQITAYAKKGELSQKEYENLANYYSIMDNRAANDSISKIIAEKYPKSMAAQRALFNEFRQAKNLQAKDSIVKKMNTQVSEESNMKNYMLQSLANEYAAQGDLDKFKEYIQEMPEGTAKAGAYNSAAWDMAEKGKNLDKAAEYSQESLEILSALQEDPSQKSDFMTESQYKENLNYYNGMYADTYAFIQFKQGNVEKAVSYQARAIKGENADAEMKEHYLKYLMAAKDYEKAQAEAENFVKNNYATQKTKDYLQEAYTKNKGSKDGFEDYLKNLEKEAHNTAIAHLKKEMINEEAPRFTLKDLEGNEVSLASLKGKTVVLDFWATWCGPCKMSFPGMQMALEKLKDREDVAFLFIDTWERESEKIRKKNVEDFIAKNNYDFHVLMDTPTSEDGNEFDVVSDYGVSGIPTKFIVGPDGRIKFKSVGFDGNTDNLAEEIEMMIELAQS